MKYLSTVTQPIHRVSTYLSSPFPIIDVKSEPPKACGTEQHPSKGESKEAYWAAARTILPNLLVIKGICVQSQPSVTL